MNVFLTTEVWVTFTCPDCHDQASLQLSEMTEKGTAICPNCDEDMEMDEEVQIVPDSKKYAYGG